LPLNIAKLIFIIIIIIIIIIIVVYFRQKPIEYKKSNEQ